MNPINFSEMLDTEELQKLKEEAEDLEGQIEEMEEIFDQIKDQNDSEDEFVDLELFQQLLSKFEEIDDSNE